MPHSPAKSRSSHHASAPVRAEPPASKKHKDKDKDKDKEKDKVSAKHSAKNGSSEHTSESTKLQYEASLTTAEAVAYFASVIEGLKKGEVHFRHGAQSLTLQPSEAVAVEISASRKGHKQKVCFELRWEAGASGKLEID